MCAAIRKIDLMHRHFGTADGKCEECCHFITGRYHTRTLSKCEVYGLTHSAASDWSRRYQACGLLNKETTATRMIDFVRIDGRTPEPETPLDGQIELEVN